jgi:hypothetical protein
MSSTRRSTDGIFHQERFCSSPEFEGDSINGVAARKRIALVKDRATREVLWFIQWRSLTPGGVQQICDELLATFPERIGTPTLRKVFARKSRQPTGSELRAINEERGDYRNPFIVDDLLDDGRRARDLKDGDWQEVIVSPKQQAGDYMQSAREAAGEDLRPFLVRCCLDPGTDISKGRWFFDNLLDALMRLRARFIADARSRLADTVVSSQINGTLDFCRARKRMVLIEGVAGIGRTGTSRAWCDAQAGLARYVEVPSSSDDRSFFASIARALGVARGTSYKSQEIKVRVEEMLLASDMMLVFDESQYLFGQFIKPRKTPDRLLWIKSAFDGGSAIALVAHVDFSKWQAHFVAKTLWTDEQFVRRVNRHVVLPAEHSREDMLKIARSHHPDGDERSWKLLASYALGTEKKQASGIVEALESARYRAEQAGRETPTFADIEAALIHDHKFLNSSAASDLQVPRMTIAEPGKRGRNGDRGGRFETFQFESGCPAPASKS